MRKIIVTAFITLDGVVEAPGGNETNHPHRGWQVQFGGPDTGKYKLDELAAADALLLGRNTYEMFADYWPTQRGAGFADSINGYPKYVVSRTLQKADWNNSHIFRDVAADVAQLKVTSGGNILVYGSAILTRSLLRHKLVDELHLMVCPITVGGGQKLFDDNHDLDRFKLTLSRAFDNGVVVLEYAPVVA